MKTGNTVYLQVLESETKHKKTPTSPHHNHHLYIQPTPHTKVGVALVCTLLLDEKVKALFAQGLAHKAALVNIIVAAIQRPVDNTVWLRGARWVSM